MNVKFFPSIKPISGNDHLYYIDLFFEEQTDEKVPVITFISDDDEQVGDLEDHGLSGSELVKSSFKNLREIELPWVKQEFEEECILSVENEKHASEKILDKDFLKDAAAQLNAKRIKVAIPVRNSILICDADKETSVKILNQELHKLYNDFSRETISRLIFEVEDGIIKSAAVQEVSTKIFEVAQNMPATYEVNVTKSKLFGALFNIKLMAGAENMADFQNGIFQSIQMAIAEHKNNKDFNGTIEILSEIKRPEKNRVNARAINQFFTKLKDNPALKNLVKHLKEPIKVSFMFSADFRNGDTHKKLITILK